MLVESVHNKLLENRLVGFSNAQEPTEIMAGRCLICCALIQVLLITVYSKIEIKCPDQHGTVGKPLHLTCNVSCTNKGKPLDCNWKTQMKKFSCSEGENYTRGGNYTFNLTIENPSVDHNGTFTFWVQMKTGQEYIKFNVKIADPPPTTPSPPPVSTTSKESKTDTVIGENNRSYTQIIGVLCVCGLTIIAVLVLCRKKETIKCPV
ncbi:hypothetical protein KOW79_011184 [Hemibagrus wyckioides]|uniref:Immunoglobulin subtype domain-containing protein n=1 Tax=Hemibagrus wyckioides TaxID=337641 RepID=A0A9D3NPA4_9TELE|nr:hypothetical protein KOW79_011184 [Hemibagrus wyckioides]